jgi:Predicted pyridoxal phosphate-dependent enzyme apparently involved in regulation of cell wall biogenesis
MFADLIHNLRTAQEYTQGQVVLHAPVFKGREREYVLDAIDSTFVSSVGEYVTRFERMLEEYTGAARAVVCVNGTVALELALRLAGLKAGEHVITQSISFVATANAIRHAGGDPVFVDIDAHTLGLSPDALRSFLESKCRMEQGQCVLRDTGRRIAACVPMHTFGLPCRIEKIAAVCLEWNIPLVEDAAEALGSRYRDRSCGTFGLIGCFSFNGNKTITTGGGGAVITNDEELGTLAKHLTTTAKVPHQWEFIHDAVGWNFRMPNLNAALGCAQLEQIEAFIAKKRRRAARYAEVLADTPWSFIPEPPQSRSNYWLCAMLFDTPQERDIFLNESNQAGFMTRPVWHPLHLLSMYKQCGRGDLPVSEFVAARLVNLPSGVGQ